MASFTKIRRPGLIAAVSIMSVFFCVAVAFALVFFFSVPNEFEVNDVNVTMYEEFSPPEKWDGEEVTKEVSFKSMGSAPAVVRVKYLEGWVRDDGLSLSSKVDGKDAVTKNWTSGLGLDTPAWILIDGWYYYNKPLGTNDTIKIMESIQLDESVVGTRDKPLRGDYFRAQYSLSFVYEYQSLTSDDVEDLWGVSAEVNPLLGIIKWTKI